MAAEEATFAVVVACGTGPAGETVPRRIAIGGRPVVVVEVLDRWPGADHLYVKLRGSEGATYILRQDLARGLWQLVLFERDPPTAATTGGQGLG
jgi:Holliday junction resolvase